MDPFTIVGILIALVTTMVAMTMAGISPVLFVSDPGSILLVVGGAIGATFASGTKEQALGGIKVIIKAVAGGFTVDTTESINQLVGFADAARRDGLLALEGQIADIEDPFLKKGLERAGDGTAPEQLREVHETEGERMAIRHKEGAGFAQNMAGYAPAMGVAGTVIGLISMLQNLSDPSALGPAMAVAFSTTLWGVFVANYFFAPMAQKLKVISAKEVAYKELLIEGILSVQGGANPRALASKLASFLPPAEQEAVLAEEEDSG